MLPSLADGSMDLDHFFSDLRDTHLRDRHDEHAYLTDTTAGGSQGGLSSNDSSNSLPGDPFVDPLGDMALDLLDTLPGPAAKRQRVDFPEGTGASAVRDIHGR